MTLEEKRRAALDYLGDRWVLHPKNAPTPMKHGSTLEAMRQQRDGVGPRYSDLRAEARMLAWGNRK